VKHLISWKDGADHQKARSCGFIPRSLIPSNLSQPEQKGKKGIRALMAAKCQHRLLFHQVTCFIVIVGIKSTARMLGHRMANGK
jgi:hypothetical protein